MPKKRSTWNNREAVVERLRSRDGEACWLCQTIILFWPERDPDLGSVTIDHVLPVSIGGGNEDENLKLAHYLCNNVRGCSIDAEEIKSRIATLFVDGKPATRSKRRELLIEGVIRRDPVYPFCIWPRQDRFSAWPFVDGFGRVCFTDTKPEYLH